MYVHLNCTTNYIHQNDHTVELTGRPFKLNLNLFGYLLYSGLLPLLEEGEADTDGHVVDTQRNRVSLLWTVLMETGE